MKKKLSLFISLLLILSSLSHSVYALPTPAEVTDAVNICSAINMVQGTGGGVTQAYLDSIPQRYQGAILLLRLLGKENLALNYMYTTNFIDYTDFSWIEGRNILGFLYENSDVGFEGYADGTFRPFVEMTAKQYYKVMLVALGYVEYVDFEWNQTATLPGTLELAQMVGLTKLQDDDDFRISDLCVATVEALKALRKGTSTTLAQYLVDMGQIDSTVATSLGLITVAPEIVFVPIGSLSTNHPYETALAIGDTSIQISISNGTFISQLGEDNLYTTALIDGITGTLDIGSSFNSQVNLSYQNIERTSDTTVVVSIPKTINYSIPSDEQIQVLIPSSLFNENVVSPVNAGLVLIEDMGIGDSSEPIAIIRPEDFEYIASHSTRHYKQQRSLNFDGITPFSIPYFGGVYDGDDQTISNLTITATSNSGTGLFNTVGNGNIRNLIIENASVDAAGFDKVGVLVGSSQSIIMNRIEVNNSTITNAGVAGMILGENTGPLTMTYIFANSNSITSPYTGSKVGGIIGESELTGSNDFDMESISVTTLTVDAPGNVGGLIGALKGSATIDSSQALGLNLKGHQYIGGLVGFAMSGTGTISITNSSTFGTLEGNYHVGGLLGGTHAITLTDNYSGITSYTSLDASMSRLHRVIGQHFTGIATLDNTANQFATASASDSATDYSGHFTSNASGIDGADTVPPFIYPVMTKPLLLYLFGYVDPWDASLTLSIYDLINKTH